MAEEFEIGILTKKNRELINKLQNDISSLKESVKFVPNLSYSDKKYIGITSTPRNSGRSRNISIQRTVSPQSSITEHNLCHKVKALSKELPSCLKENIAIEKKTLSKNYLKSLNEQGNLRINSKVKSVHHVPVKCRSKHAAVSRNLTDNSNLSKTKIVDKVCRMWLLPHYYLLFIIMHVIIPYELVDINNNIYFIEL